MLLLCKKCDSLCKKHDEILVEKWQKAQRLSGFFRKFVFCISNVSNTVVVKNSTISYSFICNRTTDAPLFDVANDCESH